MGSTATGKAWSYGLGLVHPAGNETGGAFFRPSPTGAGNRFGADLGPPSRRLPYLAFSRRDALGDVLRAFLGVSGGQGRLLEGRAMPGQNGR